MVFLTCADDGGHVRKLSLKQHFWVFLYSDHSGSGADEKIVFMTYAAF